MQRMKTLEIFMALGKAAKAWAVAAVALLLTASSPVFAGNPWDGDYFPNVPLITHEGETVHFFDDLIKDKVVAINFIYTVCPDTCPLETARLAKVQRLLGERVGKDIFMYSITIDPENDTPEVLAKYAERYDAQPGWWFLTGKEEDITLLRRKLGLYLEEIQDGSNNHNVSLIIGNQRTGKWLKRSPFENPFVLAEQMGSWLTDWKGVAEKANTDSSYDKAPEVRDISQGEYLFRTRCMTCHTIGHGQDGLPPGLAGPDLLNVQVRRETLWLRRWLAEPDKMLEEGDPIALGLYAKYNEVPMPNMRLSRADIDDLLDYMGRESRRVQMQTARERRHASRYAAADSTASARSEAEAAAPPEETLAAATPSSDVVAVMNAWIREAHPSAPVNGGYMTLVNVGSDDVTLTGVECPGYDAVEIHEMTHVDGMMKMSQLSEVVIPAGGQARFEPGGKHLMLKGPERHLEAGEAVEMTLVFASGEKQTMSVRVVKE